MSKNIMWILIIGFVLGFISYEQLSNFSTTKGNASFWEIIGSILVPIILAIWGIYSERQKDRRDKKEKDKEYILTFVKEELIPLTFDNYKFKVPIEEVSKGEIIYLIRDFYHKLANLKQVIDISSYSYIGDYLNLLMKLALNVFIDDLSKQDLLCFHRGISSNINCIRIFLLQNEEQHKKAVLLRLNSFITVKGKVRDITIDFLKKNYSLYYDYAQDRLKFIEEIELIVKNLEKFKKDS